jgi:hypothetical protein
LTPNSATVAATATCEYATRGVRFPTLCPHGGPEGGRALEGREKSLALLRYTSNRDLFGRAGGLPYLNPGRPPPAGFRKGTP